MYFVCVLLKVVSHYDLSVVSMSAMGFQKKLDRGVGGWSELYPFFLGKLFNFAKRLKNKLIVQCLQFIRFTKATTGKHAPIDSRRQR